MCLSLFNLLKSLAVTIVLRPYHQTFVICTVAVVNHEPTLFFVPHAMEGVEYRVATVVSNRHRSIARIPVNFDDPTIR